MKKLLIAVDTYYPKKDGVVRFLENVVPRLAKKYFITILAPNFNSGSKFFESSNVNEILFPLDRKRVVANYSPVLNTKKMKSIMIREIRNSDIVFSQDIALLGRLAIKYGKRMGKPVISYVHQITWDQIREIFSENPLKAFFWGSLIKYASRHLYRKCSLLFVPSRTTAEQLKKEGIKNEKAVIHLGVDLEKFCPPKSKAAAKIEVKIPPTKFVIGYSGRISEEKGLSTLRNAFVEIKEKFPDAVLLIVGDGSGEDAEKLKKTQGAIVTGFVKDVSKYVKAMDLFVLPSLTETTSLSTMEALASGVPAITTPVGRLSEYIQNNVNGYLFQPKKEDVLKKRIITLMTEPAKLSAMGRKARQSMLDFSWDITVQKMVELFQNLTR